MPYRVKKKGEGWVVVTEGTGREHSNRVLTAAVARAQLRALYANNPEARPPKKGPTR
ncbi:MAG TPA: hypothetical protein VIU16_01920 [Gaiellaceae bacterium]